MKVKLLKKIRRRFEIEYYPNKESDKKYLLIDNTGFVGDIFSILGINEMWTSEKQTQIDRILTYCRWAYREHSKAGKFENKKSKVWYNG